MLTVFSVLLASFFPFGAMIFLMALIDTKMRNKPIKIYKSIFFHIWYIQTILIHLLATYIN